MQNYLLDEHLVDVKTLQTQLETLHHFETLAANVRDRITMLNHIEEMDKERAANRRRRITNGAIRRRGQGDVHMVELKERRFQLDEACLELSRAKLKAETLSQQYHQAQTRLVDAQVALQVDRTAQRERDLSEKISDTTAECNILHQQKTHAVQSIAKEWTDAQKLLALIEQDHLPVPFELATFVQQTKAKGSFNPTQNELQSLQDALAGLSQEYAREEALLGERVRLLRQEGEQLEDEIRKLRTGDREASFESEAPLAVRLRQLLRAELGLSVSEVVFLCNELQIPNPDWQDAVEGVLGFNRFVLLVPPEHYANAMRLYRERRYKDNLHGVALLDTERILQSEKRQPLKDSLAGEVETSHPAARAFVNMLLGGYVKCDSLEELRKYRTAVTRECFVRRNFTDSHLNPQAYRHWFIGDRSVQRQIEQRQARLAEIGEEMVSLQVKSTALNERLSLTRDKARTLIDLEHALLGLNRLDMLETQLSVLVIERQSLDSQSIELLRSKVQHCQQETIRLQEDVAALDRHIGSFETNVKMLETEQIPTLERQIDQAMQSAEDFLQTEAADEGTRDEIQQEYQHRIERQPVDVIVQNAARYENDYQTAEQRSRDRLREAKQAYSLRYDFGYDELDEATRYIAECDKLVRSELPQYEEQIVHQRSLAEQELVENFIHRLREQIEDARQQLAYLNGTLSNLRFGGERFEFINQPSPVLRQVYDMIMDSQNILGDSLFESNFRQKHQQGWDLLFDRLTLLNDDENQELRELQDYRNYLQYDIRVHYPNGDRALLSQINARKSGGETTTPFYVAMAASFAQAYRLNQPRPSDTIRLAIFDEAFGKMDTARTASALKFMREAGLQVLLATPPDKSGSLLPYVDSVCTVVRKNNQAFVIEIDKSDMLKEMESATA
ncbi:MAG: SbcC/MukB-like Walker B domain-containing protein [Anaerolineaceae bacterium]|nr:SbcC/MukB-like Walker B domain-containing protein [Anaerolineaceae bacterium]